jgi:hypothetical protein
MAALFSLKNKKVEIRSAVQIAAANFLEVVY